MNQFRQEVRRLARKEYRDTTVKLTKDVAALKRVIAEHKRRIASLERENRRLGREVGVRKAKVSSTSQEEAERMRTTGSIVRALRKRLGLTQVELARLLGVSGQSVYQWERKNDRLNFRGPTKIAFAEVRKLGVKEARKRLESLG